MNKAIYIFAATALSLLASAAVAQGHSVPWREGASRTVGFGHCAKGPCMKRSSFALSAPHRHIGKSQCEFTGSSGLTSGRKFKC